VSYAQDAELLLTQEPPCQSMLLGHRERCEPGCVHEQLQVQRAQVYAGLGLIEQLDGISADLSSIKKTVEDIDLSQ
jgi:hypothetical protein